MASAMRLFVVDSMSVFPCSSIQFVPFHRLIGFWGVRKIKDIVEGHHAIHCLTFSQSIAVKLLFTKGTLFDA
jgi:hypothetical protein